MPAVDTIKPVILLFFFLILGKRHKIRQNWKGRKKMAALFMNYVFIGKTSKGKLKTFQSPKNLLISFIPGGEGYVSPEVQRESSQPASF